MLKLIAPPEYEYRDEARELIKGELRRAVRLLDRERKRTALLAAMLADALRRLADQSPSD